MRYLIVFLFVLLTIEQVSSQIFNPIEGRHEIGIQLGGINYFGDLGRRDYISPSALGGGLLYRFNLDGRNMVRFNLIYGNLNSKDSQAEEFVRSQRDFSIENGISEFSVMWEHNFQEFIPHSSKSNKSTFYTFFGLGVTSYDELNISTFHTPFADVLGNPLLNQLNTDPTFFNSISSYTVDRQTTFSIPFGVGYKFLFKNNFVVGLDIGVRYTFTNNLDNSDLPTENIGSATDDILLSFDGVEDEITARNQDIIARHNFGNTISNDWYTFVGVNIAYVFGRKPCYCKRR